MWRNEASQGLIPPRVIYMPLVTFFLASESPTDLANSTDAAFSELLASAMVIWCCSMVWTQRRKDVVEAAERRSL